MSMKKALADARAALKDAKEKRLTAITKGVNDKPGLGAKGGMPTAAKTVLRKWGCKSFDQLIQVNTAAKKYSYIPAVEKEQVKALKEACDIAFVMSKYFDKDIKDLNNVWSRIFI